MPTEIERLIPVLSSIVAVISAAVALLTIAMIRLKMSRLRRETLDIKHETSAATKEAVDAIMRSNALLWRTSTGLARARQTTHELRQGVDERTFDSHIPYIRDLLNYVNADLQHVMEAQAGVDPSLLQALLGEVLDTKMDLEGITGLSRGKAADLLERCDRILQLLNQLVQDTKGRSS